MVTLEPAKLQDLERCYEILDAGRNFQRAQGFFQWRDDYPNRDSIRQDIAQNQGYVVRVDEVIAGYLCLCFTGEPAYEGLTGGTWLSEGPYGVVHRMAFHEDFRGKGLSSTTFELVGALCRSRGVYHLRVDTGPQNLRMQHVIEKSGFQLRGTVQYSGSDRLAYEKALYGP
jgi:GNAT superfamily N-acetyltransferase